MKVLLVDPPGWQKHSVNLGLSYLAGTLASKNIEAKILDLNNHPCTDEALQEFVRSFDPGVIGISVKTATANVSQRIAGVLKPVFPHITFVAGGPHVSLCAKEYLRESKVFDFGVTGDGETALAALVQSLMSGGKDLGSIQGLSYYRNDTLIEKRTDPQNEIDRLAYPDFEAIQDMDFQDFRYPLLTSRGCPYGCIFCCVGAISGKKWRPRDPENIVKELIEAKDKYQITSFEIMDDNFTFDVDRAKRFCSLVIQKKLHLDWWCHNGVRADKLDPELLRLMKKAGCQSVAIGIETGDEEVFKGINKGETLRDITRAVRMIKQAGILCVGYFIVGLPGDSIASTKKTVRFQRSLGLSHHTYNIAIPYPGTKMAAWVEKHGRLLQDLKETYHFGDNAKVPFETDQMSQGTLRQCLQLANDQGWVWGERDLQKTGESFRVRFGRDIQCVTFIVDRDCEGVSKNAQVEFGRAKILEIRLDESFRSLDSRYPVALREHHDYFDEIFGMAQKGADIMADIPAQKLFVQDMSKAEEEYIRGEPLPGIREWDRPEGKYYATRLKHFSPATCLPQNGIIYKDGVALPFNPAPQWEKVACGKIESGLAFISLAAYGVTSRYSADYIGTNLSAFTKELVFEGAGTTVVGEGNAPRTLFDLLLLQTDVLFVPEALAGYAHIFSGSKMNLVCQKWGPEPLALRYEPLEDFMSASAGFRRTVRHSLCSRIQGIAWRVQGIFSSFGKMIKGLTLWAQIVAIMSMATMKAQFDKVIRISR